jgi:hypothetical protein
MFRDKLSVPSSGVKDSCLQLKERYCKSMNFDVYLKNVYVLKQFVQCPMPVGIFYFVGEKGLLLNC